MNTAPQWRYVQARLQARHGERPGETDWRALEAARSLELFVERARPTALRRFTAHVNAGMTSHAIERVLRSAWRDYVAELAGWVEADWQPAVMWVAALADLPAIDALLRGEAPAWFARDPALAAFAGDDVQQRIAGLAGSPLAPLAPGKARAGTLARRWNEHWRSLWPRNARTEGLDELIETVTIHFALLARAGSRETSAPYRRDLARKLTRLFRRHGAAPVAVFSHLALVALDLQRLRGNLVRRLLFAGASAKEAA